MQPGSPGIRHLLGVLSPGERKLEGKSFYLDALKSRIAAVLVEAISHLGGTVEGFLNKDVTCVVTCSPEGLRDGRVEVTRGGSDGMREKGSSCPAKQREGILSKNSTPRPLVEVYGSRGRALLEKAIRNNERLQGSSVLANARSWGVKIIHADDFLSYVQLLKAENSKVKYRRPEQRNANKCPATRVVKAAALKSPYLKVEDSCRKYKPLHMQSMTFPTVSYSGRRCSPFEPPPPPQPERIKEKERKKAREGVQELSTSQDKPQSPLLRFPSPCRARRKNLGYCECCHEPFQNHDEHLQSEQHRGFAQDSSHYSEVDRLVAGMRPGFDPDPAQQPTPTWTRAPTPPPLVPPSPPDLEGHAHSETEHAVRSLLTHASPSHAIPPGSPAPLAPGPPPPLDTRPLSPRPDPRSPSSSSDPPVLSPQNVPPADPHSSYSDPPVLSPQAPPPRPQEESDPVHLFTPEAPVRPPAPLLPPGGLEPVAVGGVTEGPNRDRPVLGDDDAPPCGRSGSLPPPLSGAQNPRKHWRSASPDAPPDKRRRTATLVKRQRSDPGGGGRRARREAKPLRSFSRGRKPAEGRRCPEAAAERGNGRSAPATEDDSGPLANGRRVFVVSSAADGTTGLFSRDPLAAAVAAPLDFASLLLGRATSSPLPKRASCRGNASADAGTERAARHLFSPPGDKTPRPAAAAAASSQDSLPSLSQSFSSVCIESALVPNLATPSPPSSDWDYELLSRLCPAPSAATPTPALPSGVLDMELLQRPCTWTRDTSYESRLCSALQPPPRPPSLCGEEAGPAAFARVMQSVEVQH